MEKMTKNAMYDVIATAMADNAEVVAFCRHEQELLAKRNLKAKERKHAKVDELVDIVYGALTDDLATIADIVAIIDNPDITVSKVTYRLTNLVKDGRAVKEQVLIVPEDGGKGRKVMAYRKA